MTASAPWWSLDFDELGHGLSVLAEAVATGDERLRDSVCDLIENDINGFAGTAADDMRQALFQVRAFGDGLEKLNEAFHDLSMQCAGQATARAVQKASKQRSAAYGKKGGRPRSDWGDDWLRLFNQRKAERPTHSAAQVCEWIAARWEDENGRPRSARTIRDGINRARKLAGNPPFHA